MNRKQRYDFILSHFREKQPVVTTELSFESPFQLLVATMLSAQCTDKRINEVTPPLFRRFPDAKTMAEADEQEVLDYVKSVSYPNSKTRHLIAMAKMLVSDFHGEVPDNGDELVKLPGVGRKTANVIQAVAFGKARIAVDTHVFRVSRRMGLVARGDNTPLKVEQSLMRYIPEEDRADAHHWLLLHGRYVCTSRKPHCDRCDFQSICPKLFDEDKVQR